MERPINIERKKACCYLCLHRLKFVEKKWQELKIAKCKMQKKKKLAEVMNY